MFVEYTYTDMQGYTHSYIPIGKFKSFFPEYRERRRLHLPEDAYTNKSFKHFDAPYVYYIKYIKEYPVYWSNVRDEHLNTNTPLMFFYMKDDEVKPITIIGPPLDIVRKLQPVHRKETKEERKRNKLYRKLHI